MFHFFFFTGAHSRAQSKKIGLRRCLPSLAWSVSASIGEGWPARAPATSSSPTTASSASARAAPWLRHRGRQRAARVGRVRNDAEMMIGVRAQGYGHRLDVRVYTNKNYRTPPSSCRRRRSPKERRPREARGVGAGKAAPARTCVRVRVPTVVRGVRGRAGAGSCSRELYPMKLSVCLPAPLHFR